MGAEAHVPTGWKRNALTLSWKDIANSGTEGKRALWGGGKNILYPDCSVSYTTAYICQNSSNVHLK